MDVRTQVVAKFGRSTLVLDFWRSWLPARLLSCLSNQEVDDDMSRLSIHSSVVGWASKILLKVGEESKLIKKEERSVHVPRGHSYTIVTERFIPLRFGGHVKKLQATGLASEEDASVRIVDGDNLIITVE